MKGAYKIYNKLTSENKVQFWAITSSCFVAIFTFFIGIVYQFFVVDKSREESRRLYHMQYVDNIKPVLQIQQDVDVFFSSYVRTQVQEMKDMIHPAIGSKENKDVIKNIQAKMYGFADSTAKFAEKYNKAIEVPKYYLYDDYKDSIQQYQDSIKVLIGAFKVINVIVRNSEKSTKQELDSLIFEVYPFDNQEMATLRGYYSILNKPKKGIEYQLECVLSIQDKVYQIQKTFKEKSFFSYKKESPYKSLWSVILFGTILLVVGFIIWILLINYVIFRKKDKSPNKESETERNRIMDEVSEMVDLYNDNDLIGDEEYISSPLTIYKRIYNKWNTLRKDVLQQQITEKRQETD